jgi:hypothetical protein
MSNGDITEREQRIRARTHALWEAAGRPGGNDDYFWHKAEDEINAEDAADAFERRAPRRL